MTFDQAKFEDDANLRGVRARDITFERATFQGRTADHSDAVVFRLGGEPETGRGDHDGEGTPRRTRNEGPVSAEELAEPERGNERIDGHMIERKRDAHNPDGI